MRALRTVSPLVLVAALAGAVAAYFLDPVSGKRRRRTTRDRTAASLRRGRQRAWRRVRHTSSDAQGLGKRLAHRLPHKAPELDDATLAHKVESILFRDRDVPKGEININAVDGVVYLRGQVERGELVSALEQRVRKVEGVRKVENLLHLPGTPAPHAP